MAPQTKPLCGNESYMDPLIIRRSQKKCVFDIECNLKPWFYCILQAIFTFV